MWTEHPTVWSMDSTFNVTRYESILVLIATLTNEKTWIPIFQAILETETSQAYDWLLDFVLQKFWLRIWDQNNSFRSRAWLRGKKDSSFLQLACFQKVGKTISSLAFSIARALLFGFICPTSYIESNLVERKTVFWTTSSPSKGSRGPRFNQEFPEAGRTCFTGSWNQSHQISWSGLNPITRRNRLQQLRSQRERGFVSTPRQSQASGPDDSEEETEY